MSDPPSPNYRSLLVTAAILVVIGWPLLYLLLNTTLPTVGPRWLFFFFWALATTGTALPFIWFLHRRFRAARPAPPHVLLRQSLWFGLFVSICVWLQINRALNLPLALLIGAGLLAFEGFLRLLERSTWRPDS